MSFACLVALFVILRYLSSSSPASPSSSACSSPSSLLRPSAAPSEVRLRAPFPESRGWGPLEAGAWGARASCQWSRLLDQRSASSGDDGGERGEGREVVDQEQQQQQHFYHSHQKHRRHHHHHLLQHALDHLCGCSNGSYFETHNKENARRTGLRLLKARAALPRLCSGLAALCVSKAAAHSGQRHGTTWSA